VTRTGWLCYALTLAVMVPLAVFGLWMYRP
jgi:hypothetical protein